MVATVTVGRGRSRSCMTVLLQNKRQGVSRPLPLGETNETGLGLRFLLLLLLDVLAFFLRHLRALRRFHFGFFDVGFGLGGVRAALVGQRLSGLFVVLRLGLA